MSKMKTSVLSIFCLSALAAVSLSFASCPRPETISFFCTLTKHGKTCFWITKDACYEASAKGFGAKIGETAGPFIRAEWWPSSSDSQSGTSSCFYQGPHGYGVINAFQGGGYGAVPKPDNGNWRKAVKPGVLSCTGRNVTECRFKYCGI